MTKKEEKEPNIKKEYFGLGYWNCNSNATKHTDQSKQWQWHRFKPRQQHSWPINWSMRRGEGFLTSQLNRVRKWPLNTPHAKTFAPSPSPSPRDPSPTSSCWFLLTLVWIQIILTAYYLSITSLFLWAVKSTLPSLSQAPELGGQGKRGGGGSLLVVGDGVHIRNSGRDGSKQQRKENTKTQHDRTSRDPAEK